MNTFYSYLLRLDGSYFIMIMHLEKVDESNSIRRKASRIHNFCLWFFTRLFLLNLMKFFPQRFFFSWNTICHKYTRNIFRSLYLKADISCLPSTPFTPPPTQHTKLNKIGGLKKKKKVEKSVQIKWNSSVHGAQTWWRGQKVPSKHHTMWKANDCCCHCSPGRKLTIAYNLTGCDKSRTDCFTVLK